MERTMLYNSEVHLWILAFLCIILIYVWTCVRRYLRWVAAINKLPGQSFILKALQIPFNKPVKDKVGFMQGFAAQHVKQNSLFALKLGPWSSVHLCKADAVKVLLSSKTELEKNSLIKFLRTTLGDSLFTCKVAKWHQRRKLLTPTFHSQILEKFAVVMNEQAEVLVRLLDDKCCQLNGTAFDICPYIFRCTLDVICETAMGQGVNAQLNKDHEYISATDSCIELISKRFMKVWLSNDWIYRRSSLGQRTHRALKIVHNLADEIIKIKRNEIEKSKIANGPVNHPLPDDVLGKKRRMAFLEMLLLESSMSGGQPLTDEDIRDEVLIFITGGYHTSALTISWALHYIGANPEVQQKIVGELDHLYGYGARHVTSSHLQDLKYLECVIKETLMLNPPAPLVGRHLTEDLKICGYTIPAGTDVLAWIYWVHRDPAHYPDPDTFNPDRFLPENSQDRHPFAFIPFSAGPRNCIGQKYGMMEVKLVLAAVLRRFKVTTVDPHLPAHIATNFFFSPLPDNTVILEPRNT